MTLNEAAQAAGLARMSSMRPDQLEASKSRSAAQREPVLRHASAPVLDVPLSPQALAALAQHQHRQRTGGADAGREGPEEGGPGSQEGLRQVHARLEAEREQQRQRRSDRAGAEEGGAPRSDVEMGLVGDDPPASEKS